ncbi:MAG TPA: MFS transporter [Burkholderiales bacterium]|jgi:MFS family permease|nr:MFS transporter [Burkholderiales bacterium]
MEALILGWYILIETGSVESLVLFASLAWLGSLISPFFGIAGDRLGFRTLLYATRAAYAMFAGVLCVLALTHALKPWHVFTIAALVGLIRPSDMMLRQVLVAQTMQPHLLMGALAIARTTGDTARIAGALAGTASVALIGMGPAYAMVTLLYVGSFALSLGVTGTAPSRGTSATKTLAGLKSAVGYVWHVPEQLGAFSIAFLVNLLAFPFFLGLLPYVAKNVYEIGQTGLGYLAASWATGALIGSLFVGGSRMRLAAGRVMLVACSLWFLGILLFGQTHTLWVGLALLFAAGVAQSFCMTPLAAVMLRSASDEMRGRVMGMRMLAVWGLPLGLLIAGPMIQHVGYTATTVIYSTLGLAATFATAWRWRGALWSASAPANAHP